MVRTSLDVSPELWLRVRHRVIDEERAIGKRVKLKDVLERALERYLETPIQSVHGDGKATKKGRVKR